MGRYTSSREQVVATCRALLERGYLEATDGNVSVRVPGEEAFAVTPSSYDYARMRPDVNAIVHTHQPYASALALVRRPIPALFDEQARFLG